MTSMMYRLVLFVTLLAVAARVEPARLIDNLVLDVTESGVTETSLLGREGEAT